MPNVTAPTRQMGNGDVITHFVDSVGTASVTYTYPKTQEKLTVRNNGQQSLSVTASGTTQTVAKGQMAVIVVDFTTFTINAVSGVTSFEVLADEKGSTFDTPEGRYFQNNGGGGGSGGGSGILVYSTLSALQTALPNGTTTPVWVTADNSWYYWSGALPTPDTTAPTITANPAAGTYMGTQSIQLTASETATIYYTTDGSTPTETSAVYNGTAIPISATGTIKAIAKDAAGNITNPVASFAYTITTVTIPATPATPTATAGNNKVDLGWSAVSGATSYKVRRDGTVIASPTTNSYSDTTAVNGTAYSYTVSAVNTAGESAQSPTASATPTAPAASVVASGLKAWFDGHDGTGTQTAWVDKSASANNATLTNFQFDATDGWQTDGSLKGDGVNDYAVTAGNIGITGAGARTIQFKVKINSLTDRALMGMGVNAGNAYFDVLVYTNSIIIYDGNAVSSISTPATVGLTADLAFVYDGTVLTMYKDGVKLAGSYTKAYNTTNAPFTLLSGGGGSFKYSANQIYYAAVYDRVLTDAEILQNYNVYK